MMIQVVSLEVVFAGKQEREELEKKWLPLLDDCRMIRNRIWSLWRAHHEQEGNDKKLRDWWNECRSKRPWPKPPLKPSDAIPADLSKQIRKDLHENFSHVFGRVIELLYNTTAKTLKTKRDADGWMRGWVAVLLDRQQASTVWEQHSIPFDRHNMAEILPPAEEGGNFRLSIKTERLFHSHNGRAFSQKVAVGLFTRKRSLRSQVETLKKIIAGTYKFRGSHLVYVPRRRKWFAKICYELPERDALELDESLTAYLIAGRHQPMRLVIRGRKIRVGGGGRYVAVSRRRLLTARWDRQAQYKWAGNGASGHGRKRLPVQRLRRDWRAFVTTCNKRYAAFVMRVCREHAVGKLVYVQPEGDRRDTRQLSTAGKVPGRRDSSFWDWHHLGKQLQSIAPREVPGMEVEVVRHSERRSKKRSGAVAVQEVT